jgi:murein DD-endopeptidase MepM/ murein hydrolase activator NlpD
VKAGFTSFFSSFFNSGTFEVLNKQVSYINLQNTTNLLEPIKNYNLALAMGGGDITTVGGQALLSETGPSGSVANLGETGLGGDNISLYVVRKGDSLSQIAELFGVSVNTIFWANDLERTSLVKEGQTLIIMPISGVKHKIVSGDTIEKIVKKYKGDLEEVLYYNNIGVDSPLSVGEEIFIPGGELDLPTVISQPIVRGTSAPTYVGYYVRPIADGMKSQGLHGYNAVDLATFCGAPILASAPGQVIVRKDYGYNGGYGNYVVVKHSNGTQTLYAHNSSNIVSVGQNVVAGQIIGYVGTTGRSTGCHVHFEVRGAKNPF